MPSGASSRGCMSPTVACLLLLLCVARAGFLDTVHQILTNEAVVEPDGSVTPGFVCDGVLLPPEQLNDDYCDCADGSDENATSACAHTGVQVGPRRGAWGPCPATGRILAVWLLPLAPQFRCRNRGYTPVLLPSSLVHDGVCDCCDGRWVEFAVLVVLLSHNTTVCACVCAACCWRPPQRRSSGSVRKRV